MNTLGQHQNDITGLKTLDLEHYERIFKVFQAENDSKKFYFYNILKKIQMPDNINSDFTDIYNTKSAIPFTTASYNIYGDIRLWWLLYLINKENIGNNIFVIPPSTQLKYIKIEYLTLVFKQITDIVIFNGRHY